MRVYKPFDFDLSLINEATGEEYTKNVVLSYEENKEFAEIATEEEQQAFLENLPSTQAALRELAAKAGQGSNKNES